MNSTSKLDKHGRAFGQHIAGRPELRALMEQAREEFAAGVSEDEVRRRTRRRAQNNALAGLRILLPGLSRRVLRAPAPLVLRLIAEHLARQWKNKKVRDGVARITEAVGWDAWLVGYIVDWAKTGKPGPAFKGFQGGVHPGQMGPQGEQFPVVVLVAAPTSNLDALIEELRSVYQQTMPRASLLSVRDPEVRARWYRLFRERMTDREIAEMELKSADGFVTWMVHDEEYKDELQLLTARVKTARTRWAKQVTEITEF